MLRGAIVVLGVATGNIFGRLVVFNVGQECTLFGFSGLQLFDANGTALPTNAVWDLPPAPSFVTLFDEARKADARRQFRNMAPIMRVLAALGRSARMSPADAANVLIEVDEINGRLGPDFDALTCPVDYIVGTGVHMGASKANVRTMRDTATVVAAEHDNVSVFATVPCNHVQILTRAADTVVSAIDDLASRTGVSEYASG